MKRIQIDDDIQRFLLSHAAELDESPSSILRRTLRLDPPPNTVEIDDDVYQFLVRRAISLQESAASILRRELHIGSTEEPAIIEFHIQAGTSGHPWNTREQPVMAHVGNTLRIFNDDTVAHRLHTSGVPFPHPASNIAPGQSADFVLQGLFNALTSGPLTDHNFGPAAEFWIVVQPAS